MRHPFRLIAVCAAVVAALVPVAAAQAKPVKWTAISAPNQSNTTQVSVFRNTDWSLTVASRLKASEAATEADIVTIPIAKNGTPGAAQVIASGTQWTILTSPSIIKLGNQRMVVFGGTNATYDGLWAYILDSGSAVPFTGSGNSPTAGTGFVTAASTSKGALATWSNTFGLAAMPLMTYASPAQGLPIAGCCAYNAAIVDDGSRTWVVYDSNYASTVGLWTQEVDPTTGAAIGAASLVPKSVVDGGFSSPVDTRSAVAGAPSGAFVAWAQGYPATNRVALWRIGSPKPKLWSPGYAVGPVDVSRTTTGALWLAWADKYKGHIYARKSNAKMTAWGPVIKVGRVKPNHETVYKIVIDGVRPDGKLDLLVSSATYASAPTWYHALISP